MDVNQIRELIKAVEQSDINEVIVEEAGSTITVRRGMLASVAPVAASAAPSATAAESAATPEASTESARPATWKPVVAPMVGTFYSSASPTGSPYVEEGMSVEEGQVLCILEAMKLMNEITAEEAGIVREVCAKNADPVEYGTVLLYIESV